VKLKLRRPTTGVYTGQVALAYLKYNHPEALTWGARAVAYCSCGWSKAELHGEAAEKVAEAHRA
jgi:hypothetical protein